MVIQAVLAVDFEGRQEEWYAKHRGNKVFAEETKNQIHGSDVTSKHGNTVF